MLQHISLPHERVYTHCYQDRNYKAEKNVFMSRHTVLHFSFLEKFAAFFREFYFCADCLDNASVGAEAEFSLT